MKFLLFSSILFHCLISFGQKRMIAKSEVEFYPGGAVGTIDSNYYAYSGWQGSLSEFEPVFKIHQWGLSFIVPDIDHTFRILCDSIVNYHGQSTYPIPYFKTTYNTIANGLIVSEAPHPDIEHVYAYNNDLKRTLFVGKYLGDSHDSLVYKYDAYGNWVSFLHYNVSSSAPTPNIPYYLDSLFYIPNTNLLSTRRTYSNNSGSTPYDTMQIWNLNYNGNEIENMDYYWDNGNGNANWIRHSVFNYSGSNLEEVLGYQVLNGVLTDSLLGRVKYYYNGQNNLTKIYRTNDYDTLGLTLFEYDIDGFLNKESHYVLDVNDTLYLNRVFRYYYQNTADLLENTTVSVRLHPNPTLNDILIETEGKIETIWVYNMSGQLLIEKNVGKIDISHLAPGNYIVKGRTKRGIFTEQITKL